MKLTTPRVTPVETSTKLEAAPEKKPIHTFGVPLTGSISIKAATAFKVEMPKLQSEVKPLTQEDLVQYWTEAAEALDLTELMNAAVVRPSEQTGMFEAEAQTVYFADEFKSHKLDVLEFMREKSGMPMLDCKVIPLYVSKEEVIYSPDAKYEAMLAANPKLIELRKLFPLIDY